MTGRWEAWFDQYGIKKVSDTDKSRSAYLPNIAQCAAIVAAGVTPAPVRPGLPVDLTILFDEHNTVIHSSFYHAERTGAGRPPEPRMGQDLITIWMEVGDEVLIGNIGPQLFVFRLADLPGTEEEIASGIAQHCGRSALIARAGKARGQPPKRLTTREEFIRDPFVVLAALLRAGGKCETACTSRLFNRPDGTPYLEVHHILPLSEGGEDCIENTAAVCPGCHRELHHGMHRETLRTRLRAQVAAKRLA